MAEFSDSHRPLYGRLQGDPDESDHPKVGFVQVWRRPLYRLFQWVASAGTYRIRTTSPGLIKVRVAIAAGITDSKAQAVC